MDENDAAEAATMLYQIVRGNMRRFMVMASKATDPEPVDWILDTQSYGLRIWYITTASRR